VRDFDGRVGLNNPFCQGVAAMARQCNVDVNDRREAALRRFIISLA
jgi:hypothetical protein